MVLNYQLNYLNVNYLNIVVVGDDYLQDTTNYKLITRNYT